MDVQQKLHRLNGILTELGSAAIGFSGGVDSSVLAAAAWRVLGDRAVAVTAYSATLPESEKQQAVEVAGIIGIRHVLVANDELASPAFVKNDAERCYYCKTGRFRSLVAWALAQGYRWVLEGSNADDVADYRPGMRAVGELADVRSPLLEAGFTKAEIRELARQWELPNWDKPSAACLSSRVAYGQRITEEKLRQVEAAEELIKTFCRGQVRVRHHGEVARIEVEAGQIAVLVRPAVSREVTARLQELGFKYITLDLEGYSTGSMNRILDLKQK
jgi:uncharacterized protein